MIIEMSHVDECLLESSPCTQLRLYRLELNLNADARVSVRAIQSPFDLFEKFWGLRSSVHYLASRLQQLS